MGAGLRACRGWLDISGVGDDDWNAISCQAEGEVR